MTGKQYLVIDGKKVVYVSDFFTTEENARIEYEKALNVYEKLSCKKSKVIVETIYGLGVNYEF